MQKMTEKQHKRRHMTLHRNLDELFADFITHSGHKGSFLNMPVSTLLSWSALQAEQPSHKANSHD